MEPGRRDREEGRGHLRGEPVEDAAMEPGRRDREEGGQRRGGVPQAPLWSPVVVTGKSSTTGCSLTRTSSRYGARSS